MKNKYREETNKDVYSNDMCCGCGGSDGSYSDEYVKWLESEVKKLHIQNVSIALSGFMDWLWLNHNILTNADNNKIALEKYLATL